MFLEQDLIKDWRTKNERFKAIVQETCGFYQFHNQAFSRMKCKVVTFHCDAHAISELQPHKSEERWEDVNRHYTLIILNYYRLLIPITLVFEPKLLIHIVVFWNVSERNS